jgi:hypothetical protein
MLHAAILAALVVLVLPPVVRAHCDTMKGPVVQDARAALAKGDPAPVLKWVPKEHETEVRVAFARTLDVRKLSSAAAELADRWFFETVVRLHRAGEGEPFTGLKDEEPEPIIAAADAAIQSGDAAGLARDLGARMQTGLTERLERVRAAKAHAEHTPEAGRAYVSAYVEFVHFAEKLAEATMIGETHKHTNTH